MTTGNLHYPCDFPIKVFLRTDPAAETALIRKLRAALDTDAPLEVERRVSARGNYVCLTLRFRAQSAAHATNIGGLIRTADKVLMAF